MVWAVWVLECPDEVGHGPPCPLWQQGEAEDDQDEESLGRKGMERTLE